MIAVRGALALGLCAFSAAAGAAPTQRFSAAIEQLAQGEPEAAQRSLQELVVAEPDFGLARDFLADLQARLGQRRPAATLTELAEEGRVRLDSELAVPLPGTTPDAVLRVARRVRHLIAVDLPRARLYVLENRGDGLRLVRSHYAAMGKLGWGKQQRGDNRTPVGVYRITGWIDDAALPPLYGAGAYPLDYPNLWDRYKQRTGSGIWLHGVPLANGVRPPRSSEGCVTMANADLRALQPYIDPDGTPVILSDDLRWTGPDTLQAERDRFAARLESWRSAAQDDNVDRYLQHYSAGFHAADGSDYARFAARIRQQGGPSATALSIEELSLYRYPGSADQLLLADFVAVSGAPEAQQRTRMQLYWKLDGDGQWRIFREAGS